jgi:hypothetical protein
MPSTSVAMRAGNAGLVEGLCDPLRRRSVALGLVLCYAAAWFAYAVIAKSSQDINADMAEMVVWAREPALGYPKHPPLPAWILTVWFAVLPLADWAYYLLSAVTLAAGIYLAFELSGEWLAGEKRAAVPFLLAIIPFYNFLGLKWDQNSILIPLWALAIWAFVRSLDTRQLGWAALAGVAAAAAMLTKYWSVFLVASLALAALFDRRRVVYFRSPAPWVTAGVLTVAVLPHAVWLVQEHFPPFAWVAARRTAASLPDWLLSLGNYLGGTLGYAGTALLVVLALARPSLAAIRDAWLPRDPDRRTVAVLFWTPILLPVAIAIPTHVNLLSLWNTPALNLLPVIALASPLVVLTRAALTRLAAGVIAFTLVAVLVSPIVAAVILKHGVENHAAYARAVAAAADREWRATSDRPLKLLAGPFTLISTASFYLADRPSTFTDFFPHFSPWVSDARIAREGIVIMCPVNDDYCRGKLEEMVAARPRGRRTEVTVARHWLGLEGPPARFVIVTIPPAEP